MRTSKKANKLIQELSDATVNKYNSNPRSELQEQMAEERYDKAWNKLENYIAKLEGK